MVCDANKSIPSADNTMGIPFRNNDRSFPGLAVPEKQPIGQRFALTGQNLDSFRGLDGPDDAAGSTEDRKCFLGRTLGK